MILRVALAATAASVLFYLVVGSIVDAIRSRRRSQRDEVLEALGRSVFLDYDGASEVLRDLRGIPPKVMWNVALTVPLHFDDQMSRRMVRIVGATNARRKIERLAGSMFWFRRVRAARLAHVLPQSAADIVERLLRDPSASVQAAALESFSADQVARHTTTILERLSHQSQSVQFTAQQALLRGDGRITEALSNWLETASEELATPGLEVAANLNDPRLVGQISRFATAKDPQLRKLAARATPAGALEDDLEFFLPLFNDPDEDVRASVIKSAIRLDADRFVPRIARALTDRAWKVRRTAGQALAQSDNLGELYLRAALDHHDPFAADTARNVLELRGRIPRTEPLLLEEPLDSLYEWAHR